MSQNVPPRPGPSLDGIVFIEHDQKEYGGCYTWSVELRRIFDVAWCVVAFLIICWIFFLVACLILWTNKEFLEGVDSFVGFLVVGLWFGVGEGE